MQTWHSPVMRLFLAVTAFGLIVAGCAVDTSSTGPTSTSGQASVDQTASPASTAVSDPVADFDLAALSEPVGCSLGFRVRDSSGTTGAIFSLPLDITTAAPVGGQTVFDLSSAEVAGRVLFGENLFYQLCDDVIEENEPEQMIVEQWTIVAGTLTLAEPIPADPGGGGGAGSVRASATDLVAELPNGQLLELGDLQLVNSAWGFYGG